MAEQSRGVSPGYEYQVALSFAGEDREYVRKVAEYLRRHSIAVFMDEFEEVRIWGKDLYSYLDEVYRTKAAYCVMFVSRHYLAKAWPNHERQSAQARALTEIEPYLLPARFDNTEIPGLRPTIGYIDLRGRTPESLGALILEKLGVQPDASPQDTYRRPKLGSEGLNPYQECLGLIEVIKREIPGRCGSVADQGVSCSVYESQGRTCIRVVAGGKTTYSLDIWMGGLLGSGASVGFHGQRGESMSFGNASNAWANPEPSEGPGAFRFHDLSLLSHLPGDRVLSVNELVEGLWDVICDALEHYAR